MTNHLKNILAAIDDYDRNDPESRGIDLRMDLAQIILRHLDAKGWTQRDLAFALDKKEPVVSRLVHGDSNWTAQTAGRVLHALGIRARLIESAAVTHSSFEFADEEGINQTIVVEGNCGGQIFAKKEGIAETNFQTVAQSTST